MTLDSGAKPRRFFWKHAMLALAVAGGTCASAQVLVDESGSDRNGKVGYWSSIVAGGGDVGISYYCEDDHLGNPPEMYTLRFAWREGTLWRWMTVDSYCGSHSTMRRASDGLYHIFYDSWNGIGYAHGSPSGWNVSSVDIESGLGPTHMSMALDSHQRPHLTYMNLANGGDYSLRYTWWNGTQWVRGSTEILLTDIWTPTIGFSNTALQLDSQDVPHIAFAEPSDTINAWGAIRYASLTGGAWHYEDLGTTGVDPSLAIGTDDMPRMMFNSNLGITYAYKNASGWHFETVVPGNGGSGIAMALSDTNQPFATFGMTANEDQYLARRELSGWVVTKVDGDGTNGPHKILGRYGNSIDVDEHGTPHLSYLDIDIYGPTHRCDLVYQGDAGGPPPCIRVTQRAVDQTSCNNQFTTFAALGESESAPTYAWQWQPAGSAAWIPVSDGLNSTSQSPDTFTASGSNTPLLSIPAGGLGIEALASFRCILTSTCGSTATPAAMLTVMPPPQIVEHPQSAQSCGGNAVDFYAASDTAGSHQWQWLPWTGSEWIDVQVDANIDPITGLVAFYGFLGTDGGYLQLSTIEMDPQAMHQIRCVITTDCGAVTTDAATLTSGGGMSVLEQPLSETECQGDAAEFTLVLSDGSAYIQWEMFDDEYQVWIQLNDGLNQLRELGDFTVSGATQANLMFEGFMSDDPVPSPTHGTMTLRCQAYGGCGEVTSDEVQLQVIECCPGDYNQDGGVDGADIETFFLDWETGQAAADVNRDGGVDGADVEGFFARWEGGC